MSLINRLEKINNRPFEALSNVDFPATVEFITRTIRSMVCSKFKETSIFLDVLYFLSSHAIFYSTKKYTQVI